VLQLNGDLIGRHERPSHVMRGFVFAALREDQLDVIEVEGSHFERPVDEVPIAEAMTPIQYGM
jgi:hypothetical protein